MKLPIWDQFILVLPSYAIKWKKYSNSTAKSIQQKLQQDDDIPLSSY